MYHRGKREGTVWKSICHSIAQEVHTCKQTLYGTSPSGCQICQISSADQQLQRSLEWQLAIAAQR